MSVVLMGSARAKQVENSPVNATKDSPAPTVMRVRADKRICLVGKRFHPFLPGCLMVSCSTVNLGTALSFHIPLGRGRLEFAGPWGKFTVMNLLALNCVFLKALGIQGLR